MLLYIIFDPNNKFFANNDILYDSNKIYGLVYDSAENKV